MTLSGYRLGIRFFTLLGILSLLVFVFGLDPASLSLWGMSLFFSSLWVAASGVFALSLLFLYARVLGSEGATRFLGGVFRQGILLGTFVLSLALLAYGQVFAWWNALLLLVFFLLLEFTFRKFSRAE
ncbi:MAG: hypothetical protein ABI747_03800 [Candidatus Moraniibacteriota bacterium]